jgi:hypothetical protein
MSAIYDRPGTAAKSKTRKRRKIIKPDLRKRQENISQTSSKVRQEIQFNAGSRDIKSSPPNFVLLDQERLA